MQLADEITFTLNHETIVLRASLRAAIRLERQFGGFQKIANGIQAGNLSVMGAVVREGSVTKTNLADFLDSGGALSVKVILEDLPAPLMKYVMSLAGVDPDAPAQPAQSGEAMPFREFYKRLYSIATGWLGWHPDVALDATPVEILEAQKGRVELLGAIFGSGKEDKDSKSIDLTKGRMDASTRNRLNAIGDYKQQVMP